MANARLVPKLGQRLALTPQLTQSLRILAMNAVELETYVEESLESNPVLERDPEQPAGSAGSERPAGEVRAETFSDGEAWQAGDNRWEVMYAPPGDEFEPQWRAEPTPGERLHEQIDRQPMGERERRIAHDIVDSLDDDGYFRADPGETAARVAAGAGGEVSVDEVERVLERVVQQLEPSGVGARDVGECLLLQLDPEAPVDRLVRRLILHFPDELDADDAVLARRSGCEPGEIARARKRMRRLDPFPGHAPHGGDLYVRPEIIFRRASDGEIEIEIPAYGWRGIRVSDRWEGHRWEGAERDFMERAGREARWLVQALAQRGETLHKVARCLARRQRDFLEHGMAGLRPLTLQDVADEVGLHESTISRVTHGKYAETPVGLVELRRFFSAGLPTRGGGAVTVYRVQQRIRTLIEAEVPEKPISDQALAERLGGEGIDVARRTVAKYREELGIPSSSRRRRAARAAGWQGRTD